MKIGNKRITTGINFNLGNTLVFMITCALVAFIPYVFAPFFRTFAFVQIPVDVFLIALLCPLVVCTLAFYFARKQAMSDLKHEDD